VNKNTLPRKFRQQHYKEPKCNPSWLASRQHSEAFGGFGLSQKLWQL
jgi:hypothetical protein